MAATTRKEEILRSELPPTLPLMALRSTIVYPLGTIAVQMGAPENLNILRENATAGGEKEGGGWCGGRGLGGGDRGEPINPESFIGRVGVAARVHERIN